MKFPASRAAAEMALSGPRASRVTSVLVVAGLLVAAGGGASRGAPQPEPVEERTWAGRDGKPLPLAGDEEILAFLRAAEVVAIEGISVGVTEPRVVTLESGGVVARGAFHDHHMTGERQRLVDGTLVMHFRDSYRNQPAAWEVARLLGMANTPPTVVRRIDDSEGSLQLWVENAMTERERRDGGVMFPDRIRAYRQVYDMDIFDALINNRDRSQGNFLWDGDWRLWMIDHTRSFGRERNVPSVRSLRRCSYRLWKALRELDADEVDRRLEPYMGSHERAAVMARRDEIVRRLEEKIAAEGENKVLFSYDDPGSVSVIQDG